MKIEDQEVSFDLAWEMKELGAEQDTIFAWYRYKNFEPYIALMSCAGCDETIPEEYNDGYTETPKKICSTYTVAELGEMLPRVSFSMNMADKNEESRWICDAHLLYPRKYARTEADARAKMWIYLKKKGGRKIKC